MSANTAKLAVSRKAQALAEGYYRFLVAHYVAVNPVSINALPPRGRLGEEPIGEVPRNDGSTHKISLHHYLNQLRTDQAHQRDFLRVWAMGALLTLGDALRDHGYFDRAPILELVYHLRNGMAHGNRFHIRNEGLKRFPAHNRDALVRSELGTVFEVTPESTGTILFEFMGPGDVIDLLQAVELHLARKLEG